NVGPYNGVRVNDIQIHEPMLSNTAIVLANQSVALGENGWVSREYSITQDDIDRKYVDNKTGGQWKNASGCSVKDISGTAVDNNQPTKIILYQKPDLRLKKTVLNKGTGEDGQFTIGDDIIYLFEIKHAGEIAVENMQIIDRMIQAEAIPVAASRILN